MNLESATGQGIVRAVSFESLEQTRLDAEAAAAYAQRAPFAVTIGVGRAAIAVYFSRASAAAAFAERFGDMLDDRTPDAVVYAVALADEAYFWRSPDRVRRWPHAATDELIVFFADNVALHEYLSTSADIGIHAAVIADETGAIALAGVSTAGKTTTAIAAVRTGYRFYSDERCIVQDGRVVPFLRAVTVREGGRSALLAGGKAESRLDVRLRGLPARGDTAIRPRELFGEDAGGPPRPLRSVFMIAGRDATPSVERASPHAALPALMPSMITGATGIDRAARLLAEMHHVPIYRLRLGTPGATVKLIERTLVEAVAGAEH